MHALRHGLALACHACQHRAQLEDPAPSELLAGLGRFLDQHRACGRPPAVASHDLSFGEGGGGTTTPF